MNKKQLTVLALLIAQAVVKEMGKEQKCSAKNAEYVDIHVAAEMLGYSITYMRQIKNRFSFIKVGTNKQGRIMFKRADIVKYYNQNLKDYEN